MYHRHDEKGLNWEPGGVRSGAGVRRREETTPRDVREIPSYAVIGAAENHIQMVLGKKDVFPRILPAK